MSTERPETPPKPFPSIPFRRDPDFVQRGDILDQIDRCCSEPAGRVALLGLGGVGKSQLAIEFAHRIAEARTDVWVFWIHAATQARVEEDFRKIADIVKVAGRMQPKANIPLLVQNWLSNEGNGRWIIVLDSADNGEVLYCADATGCDPRPLATYLPQSRNGSVVVTTRSRDVAYKLTGSNKSIIEVGPMAQSDALILLENKLGSISNFDMANNLIKTLDYIPLAISQAAAYIQARAPRSSIEKYLAELQESDRRMIKLLEHDAGDMRRDGVASDAVLSTWQISFTYIRSQRPSAADLLSFMSFFDRQGIPEWVLNPPRKITDTTTQGSRFDGTGDSHSEGSDNYSNSDLHSESSSDTGGEFEEDILMLRNLCLIGVNEEGDKFEMHRLVQLSIKAWLKRSEQQDIVRQQYIERMASSFPMEEYKNWATCQELFAHIQVAVDYRPNEERLEEWATLCYNGAKYAWSQGKYDIAERMVVKSWKAREKKLGKDNDLTLVSMTLLALVLSDKGWWEEAEKLDLQVLETRKIKLGAEHPDTLVNMANLAATYWHQGRWEEAERLQVQVVDISKIKLGRADYSSTLTYMGNLAYMYRNQGRLEEAEKLDLQVLETRKIELGAEHPKTLISMGNLASTYADQGRWKEAEKLQVQVMENRKIKLGADHPGTLGIMDSLALTYFNQGQWEEAERLQVQVMENRKIKLGADHPDTLASISTLASTYKSQGRWEEAEKLELHAIEISKTRFRADHPHILASMRGLASIYYSQGRWQEAEKLQVQVMENRKLKLGADHPKTLTSIADLSFTYLAQGRWEEAEKLSLQVMETRKLKLGADHPDTLTSIANFASICLDQGRWEEAEKLNMQAMEISKIKLGANHPSTLVILANIATTYWHQARWEEAEKLYMQVTTMNKTMFGADHPSTLTGMSNLASALIRQGRWDEAEKLGPPANSRPGAPTYPGNFEGGGRMEPE
ncbi:kinesin light chain 3 [Trichoderma arundinaceum]|uniref:Kinesin light chain 3 n=1 Tax=Trichoderma arundinaceum TaxID=490622 RepID=A0A395NYM1_TRIAR|nr:kinesin light chain 3 [Trichoderma arundinaceum]